MGEVQLLVRVVGPGPVVAEGRGAAVAVLWGAVEEQEEGEEEGAAAQEEEQESVVEAVEAAAVEEEEVVVVEAVDAESVWTIHISPADGWSSSCGFIYEV